MTTGRFTLGPTESDLVGHWVSIGGRTEGDAICKRIERLVSEALELLARSRDGWETLYRDPADGRLWERTYPNSGWHGGGPPRLRVIALTEAQSKYAQPWDHAGPEK